MLVEISQSFLKANSLLCWWLFSFMMLFNSAVVAQQQPLIDDIQSIKQQVLELNKDIFILEQELLFPSETQLSVYVSLDIGNYFKLDAVKLTLDDKMVSAYLYTDRQVDALHRGGIQRLYQGNISHGEHEIIAVFTGFGPNGENFRRATNLTFKKDHEAKHLELKIIDLTALQQPKFVIKEW
jgi:hypothetical protein